MKSKPKAMMTRRCFLAGFLGSTAIPAFAGPPERSLFPEARPLILKEIPHANLAGIVAAAGLSGKVSCVVADARSGEVLEVLNPVLTLPPASVAKAVTALYAWEALGPGHRFHTRVLASGVTNGGIVQGDIALVGGGDPTIDTDDIFDMVAKLKNSGVRGVQGAFRVYTGGIPEIDEIDKDQPEHVGYNPAVSALNLNYNRVYFEWKPNGNGYQVSMDARSKKHRPAVEFARMSIRDRNLPIYTYANRNGRDEWTVASRALGKGGGRWLPVRKPAIYFADVFRTFARSHGIELPEPEFIAGPAPTGRVLVDLPSADLRSVMTDMLKFSTNLTAELVGLSSSRTLGRKSDGLRSSGAAMSDWVKSRLGTKRAKFVDHSGLGDGSRISARDMVTALLASGANGPLIQIMKPFKIADEQRKPLADQPAEVVAKTGSLNFVSSLAGYIRQPNGRLLAFAIFTADMTARGRIAKDDRERPRGSVSWSRRSRSLQNELVKRWALAK